MKRLCSAPNLALATLWADQVQAGGVDCTVQRVWTSSIAGEIPPDQALPEVWVMDDSQLEHAKALLHEVQNPPHQRWFCDACQELVEGPFEQCWNCGTARPT